MMTIHKLTARDGYQYLTRQVAGGDVPRERGQDPGDYYTAHGNPPGRFAGQGAGLLGVAGQEATEERMRALFGMGMHPEADRIIRDYLAEHVTAGMSDAELKAAALRAEAAASLGTPFPQYQPITPFAQRVSERVTALEATAGREATTAEVNKIRAQEARRARAARSPASTWCSPRSSPRRWSVRWTSVPMCGPPCGQRTRPRGMPP